MRKILKEWIQIALGLLVFAFGVHLTIHANIGLAPWDTLAMGIANHTKLNFGLSATAVSATVLIIDILLKEEIGFGTIIDTLLTGNFVQMFNDLNPLRENNNTFLGIIIMLLGFVFMALGMAIYMKAGEGCGPRDALLVGLGKRMKRIPIGLVEILLWLTVLIAGFILGGPVGIGTLISTFGAGIMMQLVYNAIHFEPRDIKHRSIIETSTEMIASRKKL